MNDLQNNHTVYRHVSPSGKSYVGQTLNYKQRSYIHKRATTHCVAFASAIKKYGWNNFEHQILATGLTLHAANHFEVFYINHFNSIAPNGYNIRGGGDNLRVHEDTKKKIKESTSGDNHYIRRYRLVGILNPSYGRKASDETRKKQSDKAKLRPPVSDETKKKMSEIMSGENNYLTGMVGELNSFSKKYVVIKPDGNIDVVIGLNEYCKKNKLSKCLFAVANKKQEQSMGYKCYHYDDFMRKYSYESNS